jgi:hypothetical protein
MQTRKEKSKEFIALCEKYEVNPDNIPEIMSVETAYQARGLEREKCIPDVACVPGRHQVALTGTLDLFIIHEAFNVDQETGELYKPNWNDRNEYKWSYWFDMEKDKNNPSGFRFIGSGCDYVTTTSTGGSRLCNRNPDIDVFIAKHFTDIFRNVMVFQD